MLEICKFLERAGISSAVEETKLHLSVLKQIKHYKPVEANSLGDCAYGGKCTVPDISYQRQAPLMRDRAQLGAIYDTEYRRPTRSALKSNQS